MQLQHEKTIVFDFGNVLINLDYPKCFRAFKKVLGKDFSAGLPQKTEEHLFRYEKGELNTEAFLWHLQQYKPEAEIRGIINAWNAILDEMTFSRFQMVEQLRQNYNIVMLSNINEMHEKWIHKHIKDKMNIDDFHGLYFDKVYYSHLIGLRKPDKETYAFVTQDLGIQASTILFIDDKEENITAATSFGWNGVLHNAEEDIINNIAGYLQKFEGRT